MNSSPSSAPPIAPELEANWDDETAPGLDLDDPLNEFDRVTAIPELPTDLYVKRAMATAEDSRAPWPVASDEPTSDDNGPPSRNADSTAPYAAILPQNSAPTTRPLAVTVPVRSPGVPPRSPSLTGLSLAELDSDSRLKVGPSPKAHDPLLELMLDEPDAEAPSAETDASAIAAMKDRYAMGDFSGALVVAEGIIADSPGDPEAPRYAQSCRDVLTQMYSARLGSLEQIVAVAVPSDQVRWLTLDHRAGFLLSLIDGGSSVEQLLDISGMTRLDALRILYQLLDQRVISLGS